MSYDVKVFEPHWTDDMKPDLRDHLRQIQKHAPVDFASGRGPERFSEEDLQKIVSKALERLESEIRGRAITNSSDLSAAWNAIVVDFHSNDFWGFQKETPLPKALRPKREKTPEQRLTSYLRTFLVPTLITKAMILYFGLQYSMYPGEGYGYGLIASVSLTLGSFAYFAWIMSKTETETETETE